MNNNMKAAAAEGLWLPGPALPGPLAKSKEIPDKTKKMVEDDNKKKKDD